MKPSDRILFGTGGTPRSSPAKDTISGIARIHELGLDAMELEWVRGSFPGEAHCREISEAAVSHDVRLTAHGPYYINLNANDDDIQAASRQRIFKTAYYGNLCGCESITFHCGFYLKQDAVKVFERIRDELKAITAGIVSAGIGIDIRPESTGKPTQVGSLEELIQFSLEAPGIKPCIDWSHLYARNGEGNNPAAFQSVLDAIRAALGQKSLGQMHMHISGIEFGPRGEKRHLDLHESDIDYRGLLNVLKDNDVRGILVCESPSLERDALIMKEYYESL